MPKKPLTFDEVRKIGLTFPAVEESTAHGSPALKFRGKLLACVPINRSAEPDSLAVSVDLDDRAVLLAEAPDTYYVTEHYRPYEIVLVRLSKLDPDMLRDLLGMSYGFVSRKSAKPSQALSRRNRRRRPATP